MRVLSSKLKIPVVALLKQNSRKSYELNFSGGLTMDQNVLEDCRGHQQCEKDTGFQIAGHDGF